MSFVDVRGQVPRAHVTHVEHTDITGQKRITIFERALLGSSRTRSTTYTGSCTQTGCGTALSAGRGPGGSTEPDTRRVQSELGRLHV